MPIAYSFFYENIHRNLEKNFEYEVFCVVHDANKCISFEKVLRMIPRFYNYTRSRRYFYFYFAKVSFQYFSHILKPSSTIYRGDVYV